MQVYTPILEWGPPTITAPTLLATYISKQQRERAYEDLITSYDAPRAPAPTVQAGQAAEAVAANDPALLGSQVGSAPASGVPILWVLAGLGAIYFLTR